MQDQFLFLVVLPVIGATIVFSILWVYLSSYKYKGLPKAFIEGFTGSQYLLTRGVEKGLTDLFYDIDVSITDHSVLKSIADWYVVTIYKISKQVGRIDRLAFVEKDSGPVGAILLAGILVEKTKIPAIIVRLRRRLTLNSIKGGGVKGSERVILISDVLTSGGGIKKAAHKLKASGIYVQAALVLVNRASSENIKELEKDLAIPIYYALKAEDKKDFEEQSPMKELIKKLKEKKKEGDSKVTPRRKSIAA